MQKPSLISWSRINCASPPPPPPLLQRHISVYMCTHSSSFSSASIQSLLFRLTKLLLPRGSESWSWRSASRSPFTIKICGSPTKDLAKHSLDSFFRSWSPLSRLPAHINPQLESIWTSNEHYIYIYVYNVIYLYNSKNKNSCENVSLPPTELEADRLGVFRPCWGAQIWGLGLRFWCRV